MQEVRKTMFRLERAVGARRLGRLPGGPAFVLASVALVLAGAARLEAYGATVAVSRGADGSIGDDETSILRISRDGRFALVRSQADNLLAGQVASSSAALFHFDRVSKRLTLVSHAAGSPLTPANGDVFAAFVSDDGRYVAFGSSATDLVAGLADGNGGDDVFLWERDTGVTVLVSRSSASATTTGNCGAGVRGLSADGRFVLYSSCATDLPTVATDANGSENDLVLFDRLGAHRLVSHAAGSSESTTANGNTGSGVLSADGSWVAFVSQASNVVTGVTDGNGQRDAFLWERAAAPAGSTRLLSRSKSSASTASDGATRSTLSISPDGLFVHFASSGTDVAGTTSDTNGEADLFQFDRAANLVRLVTRSHGSATVTANAEVNGWAASADGAFVAFESRATNLVDGLDDPAESADVFFWARVGNEVVLVTRSADDPGSVANGGSEEVAISEDGSIVAFTSFATDLVDGGSDGNGSTDVFVWSATEGTTGFVSHSLGAPLFSGGNGLSSTPRITADGARIFFESLADDLVPSDNSDFRDAYYSGPEEIFTDGFASGDRARWSSSVP